ncbi:hypothetical protein CEV33_2683 [Brucella grignonensis]|uniref:Uncharacterized protein n=1 Tax=Brucella grignonensis TaxID=94627 RepID=A0A256F3H6_9HYPH|nr:hypothetical protein CEV33_2683 [Brucella grignonensis]
MVGRSHLNEAELRPEGRFPNKFGIDSHKVGFGEGGYGLFKGLCCRNELHVLLFRQRRAACRAARMILRGNNTEIVIFVDIFCQAGLTQTVSA